MIRPQQIALTIGDAHLDVVPALGGGIAGLSVAGRPVLKPWSGHLDDGPFALAANILVPFSNRVSGGGFEWEGKTYALPANTNEPLPIHGDAFQKPWDLHDRDSNSLTLILKNGQFGPFYYTAQIKYTLNETSLTIALSVENTGTVALPFGCGLHPQFPRDDQTRLAFNAQRIWFNNAEHLPSHELELSASPSLNFKDSRPLPNDMINNAYTGWDGVTHIQQGQNAVSIKLTASKILSTAMIFSPNAKADFFSFEPVSHPIDAFHLAGYPGLVALAPNDSLSASVIVAWESDKMRI
ncbi:MAG: aldose 1-epimerase [Asticcacaulis sp.]